MNILYVITSYPPSIGGAQLYLHYLAKFLSKRHRIEVISQLDKTIERWLWDTTFFAPLKNKKYNVDNIPVKQVNFDLAERILLVPFIIPYYLTQMISSDVLAKILEKKISNAVTFDKIDIIHSGKTGREYLSLAALKLARRLKVPFVFTPFHHPRWEGWMHRAYLHICKEADALIALTENEKKKFIKLGVAENKIHITGHAPILSNKIGDSNWFRSKYNINDGMVLFLGQKFAYKGFDLLIKAAKYVWRKYPTVKFVFIGPETRYSRKIFEKVKNNPNIIDIEPIGPESMEKESALAACDILCLPSSQESFGAVFVEAWSFNKPVIGADIYSTREVIRNGLDGFVVKRRPAELASRIMELFDRPAIREKMGKRGHEKVNEKFNWENISNLIEQIYKSLI